jgi:hypothetical protein
MNSLNEITLFYVVNLQVKLTSILIAPSITFIFNLSIRTGIYIDEWKLATFQKFIPIILIFASKLVTHSDMFFLACSQVALSEQVTPENIHTSCTEENWKLTLPLWMS